MCKAEKIFERTLGYDPKDIEPPLNQQEMWNTIRAHKLSQHVPNPLNSPKPEFVYKIAEEKQKRTSDPYVILERISSDRTIIHQTFIFGKVDLNGILNIASDIPEYLWCEVD